MQHQPDKIAPECWLNSPLSIARFYGGCKIEGIYFVLCPSTNYLIREDVWRKEIRIEKIKRAERNKWMKTKQLALNKI